MDHGEFARWLEQACRAGQLALASLLAGVVTEQAPTLAQALEGAGPAGFLEPELFAFVARDEPALGLEQILAHALFAARGHAEVAVRSDADGVIVLPGFGSLHTAQRDRGMTLDWRESGPCLRADGRLVERVAQPTPRLASAPFALTAFASPSFAPLFIDDRGTRVEVRVGCHDDALRDQLERACALLAVHAPDDFARMSEVVRSVLLYDSGAGEQPYSFANLGAHGVAFLNVRVHSTVSLLEDLLHQSSHVIFSAATVNKAALFRVDPDTPLQELSPHGDHHGLYESFHGLYTQTRINLCLRALHRAQVFTGADAHELRGRIADDMRRFAAAVHILGDPGFYSDLGWWLFSYFKRSFTELYSEQRALIEAHDTANQPYIFSYRKFLERNPLPG